MVGQVFGRLTVLRHILVPGNYHKCYECLCQCGKKVTVEERNLINGRIVSCGCAKIDFLKKYATKHGLYKTPLYRRWEAIKGRCYNKKRQEYKNYGGRGIKMCKDWKDNPKAFADWAISNGYKKSLTIDRINNDGDYCPENCRWVTRKEQQRNRRANVLLSLNGETHVLADWAVLLGVSANTISYHLKRGKTFDEIYKRFKK